MCLEFVEVADRPAVPAGICVECEIRAASAGYCGLCDKALCALCREAHTAAERGKEVVL